MPCGADARRELGCSADKLRNHDILTSLDILTTSSYRRLPVSIKVCDSISLIPPTPLTDAVSRTFMDIEGSMRCRLRMSEAIPFEMSQYRIGEFRP